MSAAPFCVSFNTKLSTESKNFTYFQHPDSLCSSFLLNDWLTTVTHFTQSITWTVHSQLDPAK